jgi:hypothetical protein
MVSAGISGCRPFWMVPSYPIEIKGNSEPFEQNKSRWISLRPSPSYLRGTSWFHRAS